MSEDQWKDMYQQFQVLQQQIEQLAHHLELLNQQHAELDISKKAVAKLAETKLETEILAPIANGIFFKSELKDNQKLIVNVGANTTVEKSIPEVVELLAGHQKDLFEQIQEAENVLQDLQSQAMKIYETVEEI